MNANGGYFEPMQPKCDFFDFGMYSFRADYTEMHPKDNFGDFGMHELSDDFRYKASQR